MADGKINKGDKKDEPRPPQRAPKGTSEEKRAGLKEFSLYLDLPLLSSQPLSNFFLKTSLFFYHMISQSHI